MEFKYSKEALKKIYPCLETFRSKFETPLANSGFFQKFPMFSRRHPTPEVKLWRAVLDKALFDILRGPDAKLGTYKDRREIVSAYRETVYWLYDRDARGDFAETCDLADLDSSFVKSIFIALVKYRRSLEET